MSTTFAELLDRIEAEGVDDTQVKKLANQKYAELVSKSGFLRKVVSFGTTVAAQGVYDVPAAVRRVRALWIVTSDATTLQYKDRISEDEMLGIHAGTMFVASGAYVFAQQFDSNGNAQVELYPAPVASGGTVYGRVTSAPTVLVNTTDVLVVPDEFIDGLVDGIRSPILREQDEYVTEAQSLDASFKTTIQELSAYRDSFTVVEGPVTIRMGSGRYR